MITKAVLFDLDDTLLWDERSVEEAFSATCAVAAERRELSAEQLEAAVRSEAVKLYQSYETFPFTQQIGINPFEGLWANFNDDQFSAEFQKLQQIAPIYRRDAWTNGLLAIGIDDPALGQELAERFYSERRARPIVYEETYEVLDQLKGKVKLLLLTNGSPDLQQEKLAAVPRLAPYFDYIVIWGAFGEGKPSASIFHHCMKLLDIQADEAIMVGDKLTTDIKGALGVKMKAVWINRKNQRHTEEIRPDYEIHNLREIFNIVRLNSIQH